ncbi:MAG TPA: hypothetical protein VFI73_10055, partial [Candidatus Nitrosopolaris sp.]|nr:hypothetical protein [Candidatus Nitrosopolaris sp.]
MNKKISSPIIKAITAGTILALLVFANSMMSNSLISNSYAAKKNTPVRNQTILPIPAPLPTPPPELPTGLPIPPPGLLGTLIVTTKVSGGNKNPSDFTITVSGDSPRPASFAGSSSGTTVTLKPGTYNVTESSLSGYTTTYSSGCSGSIGGAQKNKCIITNKYTPPPGSTTFLIVVTKVDNTNGGTKNPSDFTITVSGDSPRPASFAGSSSGTSVTLQTGKYSVSESQISGYVTTYSSGCSGTAGGGAPINCTVTNLHTPVVGNLVVTTKVDSTNGGIKKPSDFTISMKGNSPTPSSFAGSSSGTTVTLKPGIYSVTESQISGYVTTYSSGCSGSIDAGQTLSCTVANKYQQSPLGKIIVVKNVINNDRGTKKASDFMIFVTGNSPFPNNFPGSASGTLVSINAGKYAIVEASVSGYTTTYSSGCSGSITAGETINCVVSNDDIPPVPFIDTETVKLGKSAFPSDALIPLIDVGPTSNIMGGHISLNSPTSSSDHLKLIAAEITDAGVQHAVAVNLTKTLDITPTVQSLYHTDLRSTFTGINPFTGAQDRVTHFTDLFLWNNGTSAVQFAGNNTLTMKAIFKQPQFVTPAITSASHTTIPAADLGVLNLDGSSGGGSILSRFGLIPLIDVGPTSNIMGGHISLNSPTSSSDHLKLIAAEITDAGVQHAV